MTDLLERADPARGLETDMARLRAKVDDRMGSTPIATLTPLRKRNVWMAAAAAFAIVAALAAILAAVRPDPSNVFAPDVQSLGDLPGIDDVVQLASGGVQTMAADGDTIWVMTALANKLQRISAASGRVEESYTIDAYVEGVIVGGGYVWLLSYDHDGEVLRFDPATGLVDMAIPIGSLPWHASRWYDDSLWISNDQGQLHQISAAGEIVSTRAGELKGEGFGYLWVNDPITGLISSLSADGTQGEFVVPTETGLVTSDGWGVRTVVEAGRYLWLMDGNYPFGTNLSTYDLETGELRSFGRLTFGLLSITEFDNALWLISHTDHLLIRVDPDSGAVKRYPMPGKAGGLVVADGSLWVSLYQPGALVRVDPTAGLIEAAPIVSDDWNLYPHRLLCTGSDSSGGPTVLLEPADWIEYGSWSVIQAQISNLGYVVCANGYLEGEYAPAERAADLKSALISEGIEGPYVLVASGDGVHTTRLFAEGRDDVAGVVLVDPMAVGFPAFLDEQFGSDEPTRGHPAWLDLSPTVSDALSDFGDRPLAVVGGDPQSVYVSQRFIDGAGRDVAEALNTYWQDGLDFYAGLSSNSRTTVAIGTGLDMLLWDRPDLVVQEIMAVIDR